MRARQAHHSARPSLEEKMTRTAFALISAALLLAGCGIF